MRYIGGGIGHKATNFIKQTIPEPAPEIRPNTQEDTADFEEITSDVSTIPHRAHPQVGEDDIEEDLDLEKVDSEEEVDFGYGNDTDGDASEEEEVHEDEGEEDDDFADL
jgi:hypothetical protein